jgi:hypothetical protein
MHDEPQRKCGVLDSGRRSAEPLEHLEPELGPPRAGGRRRRSLRTPAARATRTVSFAAKSFRSTGRRLPAPRPPRGGRPSASARWRRDRTYFRANRWAHTAAGAALSSSKANSRSRKAFSPWSCACDEAARNGVPSGAHSNRRALRRRGTMVRLRRGGTATLAPPPMMAIGHSCSLPQPIETHPSPDRRFPKMHVAEAPTRAAARLLAWNASHRRGLPPPRASHNDQPELAPRAPTRVEDCQYDCPRPRRAGEPRRHWLGITP